MKTIEIFSDGACSGNPGPAGIGIVLKENGALVKEICQNIGSATNNIAEYRAVVTALHEAKALQAEHVIIHTDSELFFNHIRGVYQVKNGTLKPLLDEVKVLSKSFRKTEFRKVPREQNKEADVLAKKAVKLQASPDGCPDVFIIGEESPSSKG